MLPFLRWHDEQGAQITKFVEDRLFIGRVCRGVADDKRILLAHPSVSRDHAVITFDGHKLTVRDTSRNGTRVNGARITSRIDYPLADADELSFADCPQTFQACYEAVTRTQHGELEETSAVALHEYVTHVVADVRGYTSLTQSYDSDLVYGTMQRLFKCLSDAVLHCHGVVKDYAGDAIYAFWEHGSAPQSASAINACRAVLLQQQAVEEINGTLRGLPLELPHIRMGWGVATGAVMLSHFGGRQEHLALVGDSTNLAFRFAGQANKEVAEPVIICQRTAELLGTTFELKELGEVVTKGRAGKEKVFSFK